MQCEFCTDSAYLMLCRSLSDCNYCFGCVGLVQEGLPHPQRAFPRKDYFEVTARLRKELGLPA